MITYEEEYSKAEDHGQEHIFRFWNELSEEQQKRLLAQASTIDYNLVKELYSKKNEGFHDTTSKIEPPKLFTKEDQGPKRDEALELGEKAIEDGKVACFTVAGGQASRLGYDGPKGCFPATPITKKPIFQVLAEKILSAEKEYHCRLQWYIMTSKSNDAATKAFFDKNDYFGLSSDQVFFFTQGMMPALDENGKILLKDKDEIFMSPDGHGGIYDAFVKSGSIKRMKQHNIKQIFYFQIDNPLIEMFDPLFLGYHIQNNAEFSTKVVEKTDPEEKVGLVVKKDGKTDMVEYIDLSKEMAEERTSDGRLKYNAANIAMHVINTELIEHIQSNNKLSFHIQNKKVPYITEDGVKVTPEEKNGYKFERLVFDILPQTNNSVTYMVKREEEFAPIKNASGKDSPETARQMQIDLYKSWLEAAGIDKEIIKGLDAVEVSPLFASDKEEFVRKVRPDTPTWNEQLQGKNEYVFDEKTS
ncbi:MAG: UTP--glucose-1-phosphate uridylyltransferase [Nanobdellota archaeon]